MKFVLLFIFLLSTVSAPANSTDLKLEFSPESEKFEMATKEYQKIWQSDGQNIIKTLEEVSGLSFRQKKIKVIVFEGISSSGYKEKPMKMRASYSFDVKKATLIHELGHRLIEGVPITRKVDNHRVLFLFLYDVWVEIYGKDFADKMFTIESGRKGVYDYEAAWKWALEMDRKARQAKLAELRIAKDLKTVFDKFNVAFREADRETLSELLAEDYFHTNGSGRVLGKQGWLDYIKTRKVELDSGKLKIDSYRARRVWVKIYGNTGVINARIEFNGKRDNKAFNSALRITTLWIKEDGNWKRAVFHDSPVPG